MPKPTLPKCPVCNTAKHVSKTGFTGALHYCSRCRGHFEPDGEGGDYSDKNPAARIEREERRTQRRTR